MPKQDNTPDDAHDQFVADPVVARELNVSLMTLWRYDHSEEMAELGWPEKISINGRNFRSRQKLENYKTTMIKRAAADRKRLLAEEDTQRRG